MDSKGHQKSASKKTTLTAIGFANFLIIMSVGLISLMLLIAANELMKGFFSDETFNFVIGFGLLFSLVLYMGNVLKLIIEWRNRER